MVGMVRWSQIHPRIREDLLGGFGLVREKLRGNS